VTLAERIEAVRQAWLRYQAEASREGRADVPALADYWRAVRDVHRRPIETTD
jgi:hypothetical protein